jgi:tetratricopeptide (TPR) repeat protein
VRKEYEKGVEAARKAKWPEAEALFRKAVTAYPKYAICWEALGRTLEVQKQPAAAQEAYRESIQADSRYVTPHMRLMVLLGRDQRWEEVAQSAATVVQLDPYSYPIAYYFGGLANRNLKRDELAERFARDGLKADPRGTVPRLNQLMGSLLMERKAYGEALPYLKAYLQNQPTPNDAEAMKSAIAFAEKMAGGPWKESPRP